MTSPTTSNFLSANSGTTASLGVTSATYTVAAGSNQRLVAVGAIGPLGSLTLPTSPQMKHNGVSMTLQRTSQSNNANGGSNGSSSLYLYDLVIGSSTPSGTVAFTWATRSGLAQLTVFTVSDADQTVTLATTAASQSLGTDTVSSAVTDLILDFVMNGSQSTTTGYAVTVNAGQTQLSNVRLNGGTANEENLGISSSNSPGASTTTMGWTGNQSLGPRSQHIVAAFPAVATTNAATIATTEAADVFTGVGGPLIQASIAATESTDVFAALGGPLVQATVATTEDSDQFAASGGPLVQAAIATTEGPDTFAAAGGPLGQATVALVESPDTWAASGGVVGSANVAAVAVFEDDDVFAATGGPIPVFNIGGGDDAPARKRRDKRWNDERADREDMRSQLARLFRPTETPRALPPSIGPDALIKAPTSLRDDDDEVEMLIEMGAL